MKSSQRLTLSISWTEYLYDYRNSGYLSFCVDGFVRIINVCHALPICSLTRGIPKKVHFCTLVLRVNGWFDGMWYLREENILYGQHVPAKGNRKSYFLVVRPPPRAYWPHFMRKLFFKASKTGIFSLSICPLSIASMLWTVYSGL